VLAGNEDNAVARAQITAFEERLHQLGWVAGSNIRLEYRWAQGDSDRARVFAKELLDLQPDVILGTTTVVLTALKQATRSVPVVFTSLSDPVGSRLVTSLSHPGGNLTGFINYEASMGSKWVEMLKEIAPGTSRIATIFNPSVSPHIARGFYLDYIAAAAKQLAIVQTLAPVRDEAEIEYALRSAGTEPGGGLVVPPDTFTSVHRDLLVRLAAKYRLPTVYAIPAFATAGGLLCYGTDYADQFPRAASYVDRILRGEKPADLPVQAPTKFYVAVNLKTAKQLGLSIPEALLLRADEVIE
jgi:putative ABC transport system substrate-binding protein